MYGLLSYLILLIVLTEGYPKSPKIYNVLISSKKNLSPSHAYPVFEPVLRTTSLGIALPPIIYHPQTEYQPIINFNPNNYLIKPDVFDNSNNVKINGITNKNEDPSQPLPYQQFIPYDFPRAQLIQSHPNFQQQPIQRDYFPNVSNDYEKKMPEDPKTIIANLKRNPEIPDVKPPALPFKH